MELSLVNFHQGHIRSRFRTATSSDATFPCLPQFPWRWTRHHLTLFVSTVYPRARAAGI